MKFFLLLAAVVATSAVVLLPSQLASVECDMCEMAVRTVVPMMDQDTKDIENVGISPSSWWRTNSRFLVRFSRPGQPCLSFRGGRKAPDFSGNDEVLTCSLADLRKLLY